MIIHASQFEYKATFFYKKMWLSNKATKSGLFDTCSKGQVQAVRDVPGKLFPPSFSPEGLILQIRTTNDTTGIKY